jgi:hypothetical protein
MFCMSLLSAYPPGANIVRSPAASACENGRVRFRWKDYRAENKSKVMTLDADEFIRRFLLHVPPKGSAASVTSASWRTPAAPPSFQPSALLSKHRSRRRLSNTPIIASATQSSPVIASICAPSAEAAWSRSAFGRARHRRDAQHGAVTPHDHFPRTRPSGHHCTYRHADAPRRNAEARPQNLAGVLPSLICCH